MQLSTLLPLLALLVSAQANPVADPVPNAHDHPLARQAHSRRHHARQAEMLHALEARKDAEADLPRALAERPKRFIRRGAAGCRVKGSTVATNGTTNSTTTAAATTTTAANSGGNTAVVVNNAVVTSSTSTAAAATSTAASNGAAINVQLGPVEISLGLGGNAATSTSTSSSAPAATSKASSNTGNNAASLTPGGKKAGVSAGDTLGALGSHIGWWYNWAPTNEGTTSAAGATFVSTLWGGGTADSTDAQRLASFQSMSGTPQWIIGMEEPDCATGSGSAGMSIDATASLWNQLMVPKGNAGSLLLSPSMCKQMAEDGWLAQFQTKISRDFDILNLHINKNSMAGVKADLDYYYNKYKKPIWVTEFACVDDSSSFIPCTDQGQINQFISDIVDLFEADSRVYAYAYSNGYGLGNVWPMWNNGMTASGTAYLNAISRYH